MLENGLAYRIKDFERVFVKRDAMRNREGCYRWISVPIDLSSQGYTDLVDHFGCRAPAVYSAFILTAQIAAKMPQPGLLVSSQGVPLNPAMVARRCQMPPESFEELFDWSPQGNGWIELVDCRNLSSDVDGETAAVSAPYRTGQDRTPPYSHPVGGVVSSTPNGKAKRQTRAERERAELRAAVEAQKAEASA